MKKNWNRIFALCLTLALVFSLAACGQKADEPDAQDEQQTEQEEFTPASYSIAALKGPTAMGLVKLMKDSESGETTGNEYTFTLAGSADEVTPALIKGELDMACVPANLAAVLYNKTEGEIEVLAVNTLGVLYIVENGESVQSLADLKGKTVCVGDVGSGTEINAWQVLGAAGLTKDDVNAVNGSFQDGVDQLKDGKIDAAFTVAGAPTTAIVDYATTNTLNLISLTDEELAAIQEAYPFLIRDDLPSTTYTGMTGDVVCVAIQATLVASKDLSEDVVYELLKAMFDNKDALTEGHAKFGFLDPEAASAGATVPMHPGAEKYYKEVGVL